MTRQTSLSIALCVLTMASAIFAADSNPTEDFMTASDGVKIHYYVMGKGTPVILIHGYTGTAWGNWFSNGIAQALAKNHMVVDQESAHPWLLDGRRNYRPAPDYDSRSNHHRGVWGLRNSRVRSGNASEGRG